MMVIVEVAMTVVVAVAVVITNFVIVTVLWLSYFWVVVVEYWLWQLSRSICIRIC